MRSDITELIRRAGQTMILANNHTLLIEECLARLQAGDEAARHELLDAACERLQRLTRKMLRGYVRVHRWEQTDDVLQNSLMRLHRALEASHPASAADFFRLAAANIRRELLDLAKHYYGPRGAGRRHASVMGFAQPEGEPTPLDPGGFDEEDPSHLAAWTEFHRQVERLPADQREVFDLLWYQGLGQAEAAELLALSERTVKRRWAAARLRLHEALGGLLPAVCDAADNA